MCKRQSGTTGRVYPFARNISSGERVKRSLVCTSSVALLLAALLDSLQSPKHPARRFREECGGEPLRFTTSSLQPVTFVNAAEIVRQQCLVRTPLADFFRILLGLLSCQLRFCRCVSQFVRPPGKPFFQHRVDGRHEKQGQDGRDGETAHDCTCERRIGFTAGA